MGINFWPIGSSHRILVPPPILSAEHRFVKELGIVIKKTCYGTKIESDK